MGQLVCLVNITRIYELQELKACLLFVEVCVWGLKAFYAGIYYWPKLFKYTIYLRLKW